MYKTSVTKRTLRLADHENAMAEDAYKAAKEQSVAMRMAGHWDFERAEAFAQAAFDRLWAVREKWTERIYA